MIPVQEMTCSISFATSTRFLISSKTLLFLLTWSACCTLTAAQDVDLGSLAASKGFRIFGAAVGDNSGYSVSSAGDVNGDDISDVIVGSVDASPTSGLRAGISYVLFGRNVPGGAAAFGDVQLTTGATALPPSIGFRILGAVSDDSNGISVSAAGDINNDGVDDVIVGAHNADPPSSRSNAGISYVIFGRSLVTQATFPFGDIQLTTGATALAANVGFRILGAAAQDNCGISVSTAGDVNGDNICDIIVGARNADPTSGANAGISYAIFGRNIPGGVPLVIFSSQLRLCPLT